MKRRLITGKYVEQRCGCNSSWKTGFLGHKDTPNLCFSSSTKTPNQPCPECNLFPWVEGKRDIALVREAILLTESKES